MSPKHSTSSEPTGASGVSAASSRSAAVHPNIHSDGREPSIGSLVATVSQSFSDLVQGEIELAKIEIKASVKNAGTGAGMFAAAAVLLVFASIFGFIALAEGLVAAHIWRWAAYLIVFGFLVLVALVAAFLGWRKVKKVRAPQQTIATTKDSVIAVKRAASSS